MASQFTHRRNSSFAHTSICADCLQIVGTQERESELRADEAAHACHCSPQTMKTKTVYWGILCRSCSELVAFVTQPPGRPQLGSDGSRAGTIRCAQGHTHIYFPRDFRFFLSQVAIPDVVLEKNFETYKAINPFWESSFGPLPVEPPVRIQSKENSFPEEIHREAKTGPPRMLADHRRENARNAAKEMWALWGRSKLQ